jgi:tRNA-Thr(GGU) m(6)t(6)A37 methyltransferase TsaA
VCTDQGKKGGEMEGRPIKHIELRAVGFVSRDSSSEDERDRSLVSRVVVDKDLAPALDGIEAWSHIYVIFWMGEAMKREEAVLHHREGTVGVFAARSPIHPNPIGLTLVELVRREGSVLWVRGLDAYDGTPVMDVKPYPDWEHGSLLVVTDFEVPEWLEEILQEHR